MRLCMCICVHCEHLRLHAYICNCVHAPVFLCVQMCLDEIDLCVSTHLFIQGISGCTSHYQLLSCFHGTRSSMSISYRRQNRRSWGQWSRPFQRRSDPTSTSKGCSCLKTRRDKGEKTACQHCWCLVCKYYITLLYICRY